MPWQSLNRHLLLSRRCRTLPSPSVHRSNSASSFMYRLPHWLCSKRFMNTEGPISVSHSSIWSFFSLLQERKFFSHLYSSHFISLSFLSLCFCFCSRAVFHPCLIPISHCASLSQLPLTLHRRSQSFPLLIDSFFCFWYLLCTHELFRLQIVNTVNLRAAVELQETNRRWTLRATSSSQIWRHVSVKICFGWIKLKATCSCVLLYHNEDHSKSLTLIGLTQTFKFVIKV